MLTERVQDSGENGTALAVLTAEEGLFWERAWDIQRYLALVANITWLLLDALVQCQALLIVDGLVSPSFNTLQPLLGVAAKQELSIETVSLTVAVRKSLGLSHSTSKAAICNGPNERARCRPCNVHSVGWGLSIHVEWVTLLTAN